MPPEILITNSMEVNRTTQFDISVCYLSSINSVCTLNIGLNNNSNSLSLSTEIK